MSDTESKQKLTENEAVFREHNENVQKGFDALEQMARDEGHIGLVNHSDLPLHFYCECSDENCTKRIEIKPSKYEKIHKNRSRFTILKGHEAVGKVEKVVEKKEGYTIVEKLSYPPENPGSLNNTAINNA